MSLISLRLIGLLWGSNIGVLSMMINGVTRTGARMSLTIVIVTTSLLCASAWAVELSPCALSSGGSLAQVLKSCDTLFVGEVEDPGSSSEKASIRLISSWAGVSNDVPGIQAGASVSVYGIGRRYAAEGERVAVCLTKVGGKCQATSVLRTDARPHPSCDLELYRRWTLGIKRARGAKIPSEMANAWLEILRAAEIAGEVDRGLRESGYGSGILPDGEILVPALLEA